MAVIGFLHRSSCVEGAAVEGQDWRCNDSGQHTDLRCTRHHRFPYDAYSDWCSSISATARSRTSRGYLEGRASLHPPLRTGSLSDPRRFRARYPLRGGHGGVHDEIAAMGRHPGGKASGPRAGPA